MGRKKTSANSKQPFLVRAVRRLFRWLLTLMILAGVLWLAFLLVGRALCHISIGQIAELTNTKIETKSVDFNTDGSVSIEKLVIRPYKKLCDDDIILRAEKVNARFSIRSILLLRPQLKEIDINDFVLNALYDLDTGRWNLSSMKIEPPKGGSGKMPLIRLSGGVLQYSKVSNGNVNIVAELPLNARFGLDEMTPEGGYAFEINTASMHHDLGQSSLSGLWKPGMVTFTGGIASTDVPALEMAWIIDVLAVEFKYDDNRDYSLKLTIKDMFSKNTIPFEKLASAGAPFLQKVTLFTVLQKFFNQYQPRGQIDINLDASGNLNRLAKSKMSGTVLCKKVEFCYHKFLYPIQDFTGPISFTQNILTLNNLSGRHKNVELFFNGWTRDYGPKWKYDIRITSDNMALDNDLYDALGANQKKFWDAFSPSGFAQIDQRLIRSSETQTEKNLAVELLGTDAVYQNFPYPLKNLTGKLFFDSNGVKVSDVVSRLENRKITLNGKLATSEAGKQKYDISIDVNNIELDSTLERAFSDKQRELYNQFSPAGLADGHIMVSGPKDDSDSVDFIADLSFKNAFLKSNQFPQGISDIKAKAIFTPHLINVKELNGLYGQSRISLTGQIWPDAKEQQHLYKLSLGFQQTALNDDLFALMPNSMEKFVRELQPTGKVDLRIDLDKNDPNKPPDYEITADCLGNSITFERFPYPLKDITGTVIITPKNIVLQDIKAVPGDQVLAKTDKSAIKLNGQINIEDNSFSSAVLQLYANDIYFDQQLGRVLPEKAKAFYQQHMPGGLFNLNFEKIKITKAQDDEKLIEFTGDIELKKCSFTISNARTEWNTTLQTKGLYGTRGGFRSCRIAMNQARPNTLSIQGKSFTNLNAEISYNRKLRNWTTKKLVADCYGGSFAGKFSVNQPIGQPSEYMLELGFNNVDLKQFLSDTKIKETPETGYTTGKMNGSLSAGGQLGRSSSRIGRFKLAITDMQVGELSPLAKLLQVLQLTETTDYAFDKLFVDSYIRRNELLVRKLDISGNSLAFEGSGSMNLQTRDVNLILTARGKRLATSDPSIFQALTEGLSQAVIRMEVTGNFYNPQVTTKTFPFFKDSLEVLGAGR